MCFCDAHAVYPVPSLDTFWLVNARIHRARRTIRGRPLPDAVDWCTVQALCTMLKVTEYALLTAIPPKSHAPSVRDLMFLYIVLSFFGIIIFLFTSPKKKRMSKEGYKEIMGRRKNIAIG